MRLATFTEDGFTRIGVVVGEGVCDLSKASPKLPTEMIEFLKLGKSGMEAARAAAMTGATYNLEDVTLEAPVMRPGKIMAMGLNYADHISEAGLESPKRQMWFTKAVTSVAGPHQDVLKPIVSDALDYEAELCIVIGKRCKHIPRSEVPGVVAGYCCGNDVSVRDWQMRTTQFVIGKSFDTHAPIGPWIVTEDELGNPHQLNIRCFVNGERRQESNTRHLIFDCYDLISELSSAMTLEPGDIIFTGTPGGVGAAMKPPSFIKVGDTVTVEIEGIGRLENRVVAEAPGNISHGV